MDIENLATQIHQVYCKYHKNIRGSEYWTKGNYDLLDEQTKEADRYMARFILANFTPNQSFNRNCSADASQSG